MNRVSSASGGGRADRGWGLECSTLRHFGNSYCPIWCTSAPFGAITMMGKMRTEKEAGDLPRKAWICPGCGEWNGNLDVACRRCGAAYAPLTETWEE